jgi:hypothetical protein
MPNLNLSTDGDVVISSKQIPVIDCKRYGYFVNAYYYILIIIGCVVTIIYAFGLNNVCDILSCGPALWIAERSRAADLASAKSNITGLISTFVLIALSANILWSGFRFWTIKIAPPFDMSQVGSVVAANILLVLAPIYLAFFYTASPNVGGMSAIISKYPLLHGWIMYLSLSSPISIEIILYDVARVFDLPVNSAK